MSKIQEHAKNTPRLRKRRGTFVLDTGFFLVDVRHKTSRIVIHHYISFLPANAAAN